MNLLMRDEWLLHEKAEFLPVAINRHIASLRRPDGDDVEFLGIPYSPNYFPIFSSIEKALKCRMLPGFPSSSTGYLIFKPRSAMPSFDQQPLACLTFTGARKIRFWIQKILFINYLLLKLLIFTFGMQTSILESIASRDENWKIFVRFLLFCPQDVAMETLLILFDAFCLILLLNQLNGRWMMPH